MSENIPGIDEITMSITPGAAPGLAGRTTVCVELPADGPIDMPTVNAALAKLSGLNIATVESVRLRTLDVACARVLGYVEDDAPGYLRAPDGTRYALDGGWPHLPNEVLPRFSTDHTAAARLRVLVEIRKQQTAYTAALLAQKPADVAAEWWLCNAPPDAHARAFVQVMS